ncbi:hypothetical protein GRZ55_20110 [Chelativorans sp. ZYF759]|uniref:hypothetical protein n=1 Tax=Chelativorans sp. ZYF759 TaxID=2692213 RepID=UPI00145D55FC|nr:hypothetical protein [Chelativorans sp. ZYF759]NMG41551.1 hypothetical protein [Chelativorans sp. ZYF759]
MKRILALTTAALMSTAIAGTAVAQDAEFEVETGVEAGAGTDMDTTTGATGTGAAAGGTMGAAGAGANVGAVVSSINTGQFGTADVESATEISSINVIRIDELPGGEEQAAIDGALERHQDGVDDLRAAIEDNDAFYEALQDEDVSSDDVVSVQGTGDGNFTVYVR